MHFLRISINSDSYSVASTKPVERFTKLTFVQGLLFPEYLWIFDFGIDLIFNHE